MARRAVAEDRLAAGSVILGAGDEDVGYSIFSRFETDLATLHVTVELQAHRLGGVDLEADLAVGGRSDAAFFSAALATRGAAVRAP